MAKMQKEGFSKAQLVCVPLHVSACECLCMSRGKRCGNQQVKNVWEPHKPNQIFWETTTTSTTRRWGRDNGRWREEMRQFIYVKIFAQSTRSNKCYLDGERERWDGKHEVEKAFNWHESFEAEITTRTVRCAYVNRHTHTLGLSLSFSISHIRWRTLAHAATSIYISVSCVCEFIYQTFSHAIIKTNLPTVRRRRWEQQRYRAVAANS